MFWKIVSNESVSVLAIKRNYKQNKTIILNCNNVSQYYCFYCSFIQINAALKSIRELFQKHKNQTNY